MHLPKKKETGRYPGFLSDAAACYCAVPFT